MLFTRIVTFSSFLACALAAPFVPETVGKRDVVAPKMTSPTASTVWHTGRTFKVTWDTSDLPPPANITNKIGQVILGQFDANGEGHLQFGAPLAANFSILAGSVDVVAPNVPTGKYFLVLFGDSGNNGPTFTIENDSASSGSATPSPTTASSSATLIATIPGESQSENPSFLPTATFSGPLSDPSTLSNSPAPISVSSTPLSSGAPSPSGGSVSLPSSLSRSIISPLPSSSANASAAPQQTSNSISWVRVDSCLTFAAVTLSAVLLLA